MDGIKPSWLNHTMVRLMLSQCFEFNIFFHLYVLVIPLIIAFAKTLSCSQLSIQLSFSIALSVGSTMMKKLLAPKVLSY